MRHISFVLFLYKVHQHKGLSHTMFLSWLSAAEQLKGQMFNKTVL